MRRTSEEKRLLNQVIKGKFRPSVSLKEKTFWRRSQHGQIYRACLGKVFLRQDILELGAGGRLERKFDGLSFICVLLRDMDFILNGVSC